MRCVSEEVPFPSANFVSLSPMTAFASNANIVVSVANLSHGAYIEPSILNKRAPNGALS
jgi:hypothetical protein